MFRAVPFVFTKSNQTIDELSLDLSTAIVRRVVVAICDVKCKRDERATLPMRSVLCYGLMRLHKLTEKHNYRQMRAEHTLKPMRKWQFHSFQKQWPMSSTECHRMDESNGDSGHTFNVNNLTYCSKLQYKLRFECLSCQIDNEKQPTGNSRTNSR